MREKQIDPGHKGIQKTLCTVGPILLGIGLVLTVIGLVSFFMAIAGSGPPKYFWCAFVGMPLTFVGGALTSFGFLGKVARYQAQEIAPVAKDTFDYMAEGTKDGVKTMAGAIGQGLSEGGFGLGGGSATQVRCHKCNELVPADSKFCSRCGQPLEKSKPCPTCGELNDPDAKFCDNCGYKYG